MRRWIIYPLPSAMSPATTFPCESCGAGVKPGQLYCGTCGATAAITQRACPSCKQAALPSDRFCAFCGTSIPAQASTPQVASPWDAVLRRLQAATLGEFEIKRELGRGGMAAVYLAHDISLDLKVAIKVMAPGLMMGEGMIERFRLEAVTVAKLSHPNIVRVHALRQAAEDLHFIVMQYIPGRTIERVVRETGPLPIDVVRTVIGQVAHALAYAHRRGVVHRDVKPANIMLDGTGDVVVTDFGIAKVATAPSHTLTGSVVGTPAYMSPEQCFAQALTGASDQYSLGIVAFEMITGQVPFSGPSYAVMQGHTHGELPSIRDLRPDCPPELEAALRRMLAKTPEARFASINEAAAAAGARPLGEHGPLREELLRLAAVEESAVLDALYPTPASPVPQTRASIARVAPPEVPAAAPPPKVAAPTPAPVARTIVDPALLAPARAEVAGPAAERVAGKQRGFSRRLIIGAAAAAVVVVAGVLAVARPWAPPDQIVVDPPLPPPDPPSPPNPDPVVSLRIGSVPLTVAVGDTFTLAAIFQGPDSLARAPNEWRSRRPGVVRINPGGQAVALREGDVIVSLHRGRLVDSVSLHVRGSPPREPPIAVARLSVTSPAQSIRVAERTQLRAEEIDGAGNRRPPSGRVTWSSADPAIAFVDASTGEVVGRAAGRVAISARTATGRATVDIAVEAPPTPPAPDPDRPKPDPVVNTPPPPVESVRVPPPATKSAAELRSELDETVRSYARAVEAEDLGRMRAVYPAMTQTQTDAFRAFFERARDVKLTISRVDAQGQLSATVGGVVRARVTYEIAYYNTSLRRNARESASWDATLERTATGWRMLSVR